MMRAFWLVLGVMSGLDATGDENAESTLEDALAGLTFRCIGPALTSGRISDVVIQPDDPSVWYVAGPFGVFKTDNAGTTWHAVFEDQGSYSVGCLAMDPRFPHTIWVGTGENVSGRHVGFGDGIYRSLNGGKTWENMGLKESEHISKIVFHPQDCHTLYVAAEGPLWRSGGQRGVFCSRDAGSTWQCLLQINEHTGVSDLVMDPQHPNILYAAAYQRQRSVAAFMAGGPDSGIYKSMDGGKTWRRLTTGLPKGDMGRIGLAISPQKPSVVYATIEARPEEKGFYRSTDHGESWEKRCDYISGGTGPHYYQELAADPYRFDVVYQMDVWLHVTDDGGRSFRKVGEESKHSDNHALVFHPTDPDYLLVGCDGGLYESYDRGNTWKYVANLPITQFYKMALDRAMPFYHVHGGTQDNFSQIGPSRTLNQNGILNSDWSISTMADGYSCAIDPVDPNIVYAEGQVGSLHRFDRRSGERVFIQPRTVTDEKPDRWNWDAPVLISPHNPKTLYYASQRVYRSDDRGDSWTAISEDLSRNECRFSQPLMGKYWPVDALWDHLAMSYYGNVTAISESPLQEGLIYAGTDDGLIQVTEDGGQTWRLAGKRPHVPERAFVNDIMASRHDVNEVWVALDHHKAGDFTPYLLRSRDRGRSWKSISSTLPAREIVWCMAQDAVRPGLWFIGTEFGIYTSLDHGDHWTRLRGGLPRIPFRDIAVQDREVDLVGASFGRGFYILDDYLPLREMAPDFMQQDAALFPARDAWLYVEKRPLGGRDKAFQGDAFFAAPNPPFGATFTYYLKEPLRNAAESRHQSEKAHQKTTDPIPIPSFDDLRAETREPHHAVILTIRDADERVMRRLTGPTTAGIHRVTWDLRLPPVDPVQLNRPEPSPWSEPPRGPFVSPGIYSVALTLKQGAVTRKLDTKATFNVKALSLQTLEEKDRDSLLTFQSEVMGVSRVIQGSLRAANEGINRLKHMKQAYWQTPDAPPSLLSDIEARLSELEALHFDMAGPSWEDGNRLGEVRHPSLLGRLRAQLNATAPITQTHRDDLARARQQYEHLRIDLTRLLEKDVPELERQLESLGAPWTPGRSLPNYPTGEGPLP